ncbi:hypothetical protein BJV78DRAFT_1239174 [Lactifluus subvellereus]|nr:hypothetical protein BJV78DRAFT_1239174 [Lactifluus subvellereus]
MLPALLLEIALFARARAAREGIQDEEHVCVWPLREHPTIKLCANGLHDVPSATGLGGSTRTAQSPIELSTRPSGRWTESAPCSVSMARRGFNLR